VLWQAQHLVRPRLAGLALLGLAVVAAPVAVGAGAPAHRAQALRQRDSALAARSRAAVLDLYALETKLSRAQSRLATIRERADALRQERALVGMELAAARHGVEVSQRRLAERLRALYEAGGVDPLAVVLGSSSLDAALSEIESLDQIASADRSVLADVRRARSDLAVQQRRLAERQRRLDALLRSATATAQSLASTRSARVAYVSSLESQRRLTRTAIAHLQAEARTARLKAQSLEAAPAPPAAVVEQTAAVMPEAPAVDPAPRSEQAPAGEEEGRTITVVSTGYALPGRTATGLPVGLGVAAVDPSVIPLGSRFSVPGYGEAVAADVGGGVHGAMIDLWFPSLGQAHAWGSRTVTIRIH
jgi:3D (Asp-Asp-Asp) domain-containing protein